MPSKKQYDLVSDDGYDSRIPLHNDDAFHHGISFATKYIGTMDVPRPSSRVEIVAAMRRIRYEFKTKAIKKKKVTISISVDGLSISMRKKRRKKISKEEQQRLMIMQHPIYRVFYVSHDSQDLKIFSYIARDGTTNMFRCNVFKAYKKSEAMRIVRTVGQAFEVCHKISIAAQNESNDINSQEKTTEEENTKNATLSSPSRTSLTERSPSHAPSSQRASFSGSPLHKSPSRPLSGSHSLQSPPLTLRTSAGHHHTLSSGQHVGQHLSGFSSPVLSPQLDPSSNESLTLSGHHQVQLYKQRLDQQKQHTQLAQAQVHLLHQQLDAETAARKDAQVRSEQLLAQNRELLEHINTLVGQLQMMEHRLHREGATVSPSHLTQSSPFNQMSNKQSRPMSLTAAISPNNTLSPSQNTPLFGVNTAQNSSNDNSGGQDRKYTADSPDSGHREMSSDSLSAAVGVTSPDNPWQGHAGVSRLNGSQPMSFTNNSRGSARFTDLTLPLRNPFCSTYPSQQSPDKVITPKPLQDATGNKLELNFSPTTVTSPADSNLPPKINPPPKVTRSSTRLRNSTGDSVKSPDSNGGLDHKAHNGITRTSTGGSSSGHSATDSELSFSDGCSSKTGSPPDVNGNEKNVFVNTNTGPNSKLKKTTTRSSTSKGPIVTSNGPFTGLSTAALTNANDNTNNNHQLHSNRCSRELEADMDKLEQCSTTDDDDDDDTDIDILSQDLSPAEKRLSIQQANIAALDRLIMEECDVLKQSTSYQNTGRQSARSSGIFDEVKR